MTDGPLCINLYFVGYAKHGQVQYVCEGPRVDESYAVERTQLHRDFALYDADRYVVVSAELIGATYVEYHPELE